MLILSILISAYKCYWTWWMSFLSFFQRLPVLCRKLALAIPSFLHCLPLLSFEILSLPPSKTLSLHFWTEHGQGRNNCLFFQNQSETYLPSNCTLLTRLWVWQSWGAEFPGEQSSVLKSSDSSETWKESFPREAERLSLAASHLSGNSSYFMFHPFSIFFSDFRELLWRKHLLLHVLI